MKSDECHICHKMGHWANKSPQCKNKQTCGGSTGRITNIADSDKGSTYEVRQVYMAVKGVRSNEMILDTGVSLHMFHDVSYFHNKKNHQGTRLH